MTGPSGDVLGATIVLVAAAWAALPRLRRRIELSLAKPRSLAGHARIASWLAARVPFYEFREPYCFQADDAPAQIGAQRRAGFERLAARYAERFARTAAETARTAAALPDWQLTSHYRVPFPFAGLIRGAFPATVLASASQGCELIDLDGNRLFDLTGSYGVNVFGYEHYKECIARGAARVHELGPVLGTYHPLIAENVTRLQGISGHEQVSFHMSGTEAVMQAVRLARYHTRRRYLVRFCGAYHGWWGEVQPGPGNPVPARDTLTLREMHPATLRVLRGRSDIACVLVNPLQALHPNAPAPADSTLTGSGRRPNFDRAAYTEWLRALREVCTQRGIPLIFDEVFVGLRLARGGAQEYFGVRADLVTYGKTIAGGLPIGVVCGRADLMRRFSAERPADLCLARGTFNSHPYVMGAMNEFLRRLDSPFVADCYRELDRTWQTRAEALNERLNSAGLNVRVAALSSIWTVWYPRPSRYNWMLQYYLRTAGLALSWVGTGRLIFSLNYGEAEFAEVSERFVAAAQQMQADGWWWEGVADERAIKARLLKEMLIARLRRTSSGRSAPRAADAAALGDRA
ncbi:MAG: aminotransferase class III-fold pyridoxal phosphate-dependent enzyme [Steroidobacteraceae bacterium]